MRNREQEREDASAFGCLVSLSLFGMTFLVWLIWKLWLRGRRFRWDLEQETEYETGIWKGKRIGRRVLDVGTPLVHPQGYVLE